MSNRVRSFWTLLSFLCSFGIAVAQEAIENWPAPASWSLPAHLISKGEVSPSDVEAVEAVPTPPLHFVGITPCRVADTRGNGFTGQYGTPALTPAGRNMVITGQCGIPGDAQAVSFNFTAVNVTAAGFFVAYPAGGAFPPVATMVYNQNTPNLSNAAVVPLGTGGAITGVAAVTTIDLVVDVNGYYRPGVVTALNGLSGNVTLASETKGVTFTPSGQSIFLSVPQGLPPATVDQTLRYDVEGWVANNALKSNGTSVTLTGALNFSPPVRVTQSGVPFLHDPGSNTFLGYAAGADPTITGTENTGVGGAALFVNTNGSFNAALGTRALGANVGGSSNTALGHSALDENSSGSSNIAIGRAALSNLSTGNSNIGIGNNVGTNVLTGSNNIYIGNPGFNNESGQIRIGDTSLQTGTVIVGIYGAGTVGGVPVLVNGGGRLGTTTSSRRFKLDIRDIGGESGGLMDLRPVAFRYKPELDPTGLRQYGLIAEEVAEIYPELVVYDAEGRPENIRYQLLDALLLNELQKQQRSIEEQRSEIDELRSALAKIQVEISKKN
jgi:hypothetical protein